MFSNSSTEAQELALRQAGAENNTKEIIRLSQLGINLNAIAAGEKSSKKTAAHQAALNGHTEALQLLFNLGANFTLEDKDGKTPEMLASPKVKEVFDLIKYGRQALLARKTFFPITSKESQGEELTTYNAWRDEVEKKMTTTEIFKKAMHQKYKEESAKRSVPSETALIKFSEKYDRCNQHYNAMETTKIILQNAVDKHNFVGACGETAAASFAYLLKHKPRFSFGIINIMSKANRQAGHACVLLNYEGDDITNKQKWNNTLIIDPLNNYIFFYNFIEHYPIDTVFKIIDGFDLITGGSNRDVDFPTNLLLPETLKMYNNRITSLKTDIISLFEARIQEHVEFTKLTFTKMK